MIKKPLFRAAVIVAILGTSQLVFAQGLSVNTSGAAADASAMLDVSSTTQGMLVPRMTAAFRTAISSPATGLLVFQTDAPAGFYYNSGTPGAPIWVSLSTGAPTGSAGGDLAGSYPSPTIAATIGAGNDAVAAINAGSGTINAVNLNLTALNASNLTSGTVPTARMGSGTANTTTYLRGDNSWQTVSGGTTLNNGSAAGQLYVTNTTPFAVNPTPVAVSGNATLSSTGILAITSLPAISGANLTNLTPANITSGGTLPSENGSNLTNLTPANLTSGGTFPSENGSNLTSLNASNLSSGTVPVARLASSGTASSSTYLNGLGQWATPSGGGGGYVWNGSGSAGGVPGYGSFTQFPATGTAPFTSTNASVTVMSFSGTLDALYAMAVCRLTGSGADNYTLTVYKNGVATGMTVTINVPSGATVNQALTSVSNSTAVSFVAGDYFYLGGSNDNGTSGPLPSVAFQIHAH